jgi:hypothetical protein
MAGNCKVGLAFLAFAFALAAAASSASAQPLTVQAMASWVDAGGSHQTQAQVLLSIGDLLPGDADGDGAVTVLDLAIALSIFVGGPASQQALEALDVRPKPGTNGRPYGDGQILADDIQWLILRLNGTVTSP